MSDLRIGSQPVLQRQPVHGTSTPAEVANEMAPRCERTDGRSVDATTHEALRATGLARDFDPRSEDASVVTRRWGDTHVRNMTQGNLRITEVRYPDGSGFLHADRTHGERVVPGWIETKIRTYDSETVRMHADGRISVIASEVLGSEREMMLFESERFGFRIGWRERSAAQARAEFEGGVNTSSALVGKAGFVIEARKRELGIYAHGSFGIGSGVQSTTDHREDGRSALSLPGIPLSGDARQVANERHAEIGVGVRGAFSLGVGSQVTHDVEALPIVPNDPWCDPNPAAPSIQEPLEPARNTLDDLARELGIPEHVPEGERTTLEDIQRRLEESPFHERLHDAATDDLWDDFRDGRTNDEGFVEFE